MQTEVELHASASVEDRSDDAEHFVGGLGVWVGQEAERGKFCELVADLTDPRRQLAGVELPDQLHRHRQCGCGPVDVEAAGPGDGQALAQPQCQFVVSDGAALDPTYIAGARLLHIGSLSLTGATSRDATKRAIAIARAAGVAISYDPNLRPDLWPDVETMRATALPSALRSATLRAEKPEFTQST